MSHATPAAKDGFSFAGDSLYVEASGHNRHPRAKLSELQELFHPTSATGIPKDPTGHWYEAQLLHYGLPPSKTKAVAKTRLLDAVNKGNLAVPTHIQKLETELKKDWTKREREARAELKEQGTSPGKGVKRKAGSDGTAPGRGSKSSPSGKRTKSSLSTEASSTRKIQTARRGGGTKLSQGVGRGAKVTHSENSRGTYSADNAFPSESSKLRSKQTARYSGPPRGGASMGTRNGSLKEDSENENSNFFSTNNPSASGKGAPRRKQTARCTGRGGRGSMGSLSSRKHEDDLEDTTPRKDGGKLGLLNGTYAIECPELDDWEQFDGTDFSLILTLQGDTIWGAYDFGMFSGIIRIRQRPYVASDDEFEFQWRGRENSQGEMSYADNQHGWIKFLGDGRIEGMITCYGHAAFTGTRMSGQQTRSERDARSMIEEWDGYNGREYERENRARWGGSGW